MPAMHTPFSLRVLWERFRLWLDADIAYLFSGSSWALVSQVSGILIALISAYVYANYLPQTTYATYKYVLAVAAILAIPTLGGINTAVVQAVARGEDGILQRALRLRIRWGILGSVAGIIVGSYYLFQGSDTLGYSFIVFGLATPFLESLTTAQAVLVGKKAFRKGAEQQVLNSFLSAAFVIGAIFISKDPFWIIVAYILGNLIGRAITYLTARPLIQNTAVSDATVHFGVHLSLAGILGVVAANIDILSLWHGSTHDLALYAFALAAITPLQTFVKSVFNLAQPKFASQEPHLLRTTTKRRMRQAFYFTIPLVACAVAGIPFAFYILFPKYVGAIPYAIGIALSVILFPTKLYGIALTVLQNNRALYVVSIAGALATIVVTPTLVFLFGGWGAVAALPLQQLFSFVITKYYFDKITESVHHKQNTLLRQ